MNPSVQDRLDSCVRALEHVILPALPETAALAREQAMLVMGQIQIIRAQLDATPAYEAEEAEDLEAMALALLELKTVGSATGSLRKAVDAPDDGPQRERTAALQDAIDALLRSYEDGPPVAVARIVCDHGAARAAKDRAWFAAMGFDQGFAG